MKSCIEFLPRIQRISITVEDLEDIAANNGLVSAKGDKATVGVVTLKLPVAVPPQTVERKTDASSFTIRLKTEAANDTKKLRPIDAPEIQKIPSDQTRCAKCGAEALKGNIAWKQLPSEHWAELMDLWHCHKPYVAGTDESQASKVYTNGFRAEPGLAYVSDSYILVDKENLTEQCDHINPSKIWRWGIKFGINDTTPPETYISAILYETIDAHGIYTFRIQCQGTERKLLIWVFGLRSHYVLDNNLSAQGLKVFWTRDMKLGKTRPEIEEIELPGDGYEILENALMKCTAILPAEISKFGEWNVAFLRQS